LPLARTVVHDDSLPQDRRQRIGDEPRDGIGAAACELGTMQRTTFADRPAPIPAPHGEKRSPDEHRGMAPAASYALIGRFAHSADTISARSRRVVRRDGDDRGLSRAVAPGVARAALHDDLTALTVTS
jgi:hypothetical protein